MEAVDLHDAMWRGSGLSLADEWQNLAGRKGILMETMETAALAGSTTASYIPMRIPLPGTLHEGPLNSLESDLISYSKPAIAQKNDALLLKL